MFKQNKKKKEKGEFTGCQVSSYKFGFSYRGSKIQIQIGFGFYELEV
jgi:hypothetical protein